MLQKYSELNVVSVMTREGSFRQFLLLEEISTGGILSTEEIQILLLRNHVLLTEFVVTFQELLIKVLINALNVSEYVNVRQRQTAVNFAEKTSKKI